MLAGHLLIDIGNSTLSYCYEDKLDIGVKTLLHGSYQIKTLLNTLSADIAVNYVTLANVFKESITDLVQQWCDTNRVRLIVAASEPVNNGLINGYETSEQLGVDRWLAMLDIWEKQRKAFFLCERVENLH